MIKQRKGLSVINKNGLFIAQLYDTIIFEEVESGFKLNSGGWKTRHTKNCINDLLPEGYSLFQKNFKWFVTTLEGVVEFSDNMIIKKD